MHRRQLRTVSQGDELILVAAHIVSKQTPEWLWSTFWWRGADKPANHGDSWTCEDAQRSEGAGTLKSPWNNYSMDTANSFTWAKPKLAPTEPCGVPGKIGNDQQYMAVYNPFVEASLVHGLKSNCVDCHSRASTDVQAQLQMVPAVNSVTQYPALRDFEGHIRTDYMWTLRNHLDPTQGPPK